MTTQAIIEGYNLPIVENSSFLVIRNLSCEDFGFRGNFYCPILGNLNFGPYLLENSFLSKFKDPVFGIEFIKDSYNFYLYIGQFPKVENVYWVKNAETFDKYMVWRIYGSSIIAEFKEFKIGNDS